MSALAHPGAEIDPDSLIRLRFHAADARRRAQRRTSAQPGPFVTRRRGRGSETDDVRPWTHGDDVRHVDRNVTARTGQPHVRTFRDERERSTLLVADFRPPMLFGTRRAFLSVAAAEVLALVGWRTASEGGRVGLLTVGGPTPEFVRPATGERAMVTVVGALARAHRAALGDASDGPGDALDAALERAHRVLPPGGTLVLASALDHPGPLFEETVRRISHRVDVLAAVLSDGFERAPPRGTYPFRGPDGRRTVGAVDGGFSPVPDDRVDRLAVAGARAVLLPAEAGPDAAADLVEVLHGRP